MFNFLFNFYGVFLRAHFGYACKFEPTCSCYAKEAFKEHQPVKAFFMSMSRILRCHPFGSGGYDPVLSHPEVRNG